MAFTRSTLMRIGPSNDAAPPLWSYTTPDAEAVVDNADYFLDAINELPLNSLILCVTADGGTPLTYLLSVVANDGATITVTSHALLFT